MASLADLLQTILGGGLAVGGALADKEPGEVGEARQFLRNLFNTSPGGLVPDFSQTGLDFLTGQVEAPSDPFAAGGVFESFLPVLERQEEDLLSGLQTRLSAAFPSNVGIQGPEVEALRRTTGDLATNRQSLIANLLREQQNRQTTSAGALLNFGQFFPQIQERAASNLLQFSRPDPTAGAISKLGTVLLMSQLLGQGGGGILGGGQGGLGGLLGGLFGGGGGTGGGAGGGGLGELLGSLLGGGGAAGGEGAGGGGLGELLGSIFGGGGGGEGAGAAGGLDFGLQGAGLLGESGLSGLGGLLSSLGAGAGGFFAGQQVGGALGGGQDSQLLGAGSGALSGALAGFALGGPPGAIIGAIAGAFGGFGETREQQHGEKAQFLQEDLDAQRDQVFEIGNIGSTFLQQIGVPQEIMDGWQSFIESAAERSSSPGNEQLESATELNRLLTEAGAPPGQRPEAWRQQFIDFMIANTFSSGNSAFGGGPALNQIARGLTTQGDPVQQTLAEGIGLRHGGMLRSGSAIVGEDGAELLTMTPRGALVTPLPA